MTHELKALVEKLESRVKGLEASGPKPTTPAAPAAAVHNAQPEKNDGGDDDDDFELFGSDDEDEVCLKRTYDLIRLPVYM